MLESDLNSIISQIKNSKQFKKEIGLIGKDTTSTCGHITEYYTKQKELFQVQRLMIEGYSTFFFSEQIHNTDKKYTHFIDKSAIVFLQFSADVNKVYKEFVENYKLTDTTLVEVVYRPFTPNQLMTAIKSLLRKSQPIFQDKIIKHKDVSMDLATYKVYRSNKVIHLGPTEFKILQLFIQAPRTIFSRQQIIDYVWGVDKIIELRTVDVHVNRLRSLMKLEKNEIPFIKTVRASGYCLNLPGEIE